MAKTTPGGPRREDALTRARIIEAAIALLDSSGESGLTFRALAGQLATGAGAIYWHIADKSDLLAAACHELVTRALAATAPQAAPPQAIRAVALALFDTIDAHPWVGSALTRAPLQSPTACIFETLGRQVSALGVPPPEQFATVSALLSYMLGVSVQNAANAQAGRALGGDRAALLDEVAAAWSRLDAQQFPFTRSMAAQLRTHDDRADYLAGVDLILRGIASARL
jgi:AcrR family transcriptional regulator